MASNLGFFEPMPRWRLVERRGRGVTLTPAGQRLVLHADRIFAVVEEAKTDIAELQNIVAGELRIAAQPSAASSFIPVAMRQLALDHPHLDIVITTMGPAEGVAALAGRNRHCRRHIVRSAYLGGHGRSAAPVPRPAFCASTGRPQAGGEAVIDLVQLKGECWALDVASSAYCQMIRQACCDIGFEPVINGFSDSFEVVFALVEAGCSISVMPGLALREFDGSLIVK